MSSLERKLEVGRIYGIGAAAGNLSGKKVRVGDGAK